MKRSQKRTSPRHTTSTISMDAERIVATPNEVYWFAEKLSCKLCGKDLNVSEHCYPAGIPDTKHNKWYMTFLSCNLHYDLDVMWSDPKHIFVVREEVILDIDDAVHSIVRVWVEDEFTVELTSDGQTTVVSNDWFDFDHVDRDEFVAKINAIHLLK